MYTVGDKIVSVGSKALHAPFQLISNMLKVDHELVRQSQLDRPYDGPADVVSRLYSADGLQALWRGFIITLPGSYIAPALNLAARELLRPWTKPKPKESYWAKFAKSIAFGTISAVAAVLVIYPFRVTSFKYTTDVLSPATNMARKYDGLLSIWTSILSTDGIAGLYTGLPAAILGIVLYRTLYFVLYEIYVQVVRKPKTQSESAALAAGASLLAMTATYPLSIIHDRLMVTAGTPLKYGSMKQLAEQIWRAQGLKGFFRGYAVAALVTGGTMALTVISDYVKHNMLFSRRPYTTDVDSNPKKKDENLAM